MTELVVPGSVLVAELDLYAVAKAVVFTVIHFFLMTDIVSGIRAQ